MYTGKVSEPVLKRSVLRRLHENISVQCREQYGRDCAFFDVGGEAAFVSVCAAPGFERRPGTLVTAAANGLFAGGADPAALLLHAVLPCGCEEALLQRDMESFAAQAKEEGMEILGGHTQVSEAVCRPVYSVTGIGRACAARRILRPGDDLVMTKWAGLAGTAALAQNFEEELKGRYPFFLIDKAKEFLRLISAAREARAVNHFGPSAVHDLSQGGVFGGLWEMAEHAGVGLEVDLRKIPVKQETIEICEYFDVNPYELYSAGSLLIGTEHGEALVRELAEVSVPAAVIGRATSGKGRILSNGEDRRCLDRPPQDAWYRLAQKRKDAGFGSDKKGGYL